MFGGATAGTVAYPLYYEDFWKFLMHGEGWTTIGDIDEPALDFGLDHAVKAGLAPTVFIPRSKKSSTGDNPYYDKTAYNPSTDLTNVQTEVTVLTEFGDGLDAETDWGSFVTTAAGQIATVAPDASDISALVDAFETRAIKRMQRSINRISTIFDLGNANNSQFVVSHALQEDQMNETVNEFEQRLDLDIERVKSQYILAAVQGMAQYKALELNAKIAGVQGQSGVSLATIEAKQQEVDRQTLFDVDEQMYDIKVYTAAVPAFSSLGGASTIERPPSRVQSMLGAFVGNMGAGIQALSPFGPAAGLLGGGLLGIAGLLGVNEEFNRLGLP